MLRIEVNGIKYATEELLKIDAKCVDMNGNKVKIAQVNTVDIKEVLKSR